MPITRAHWHLVPRYDRSYAGRRYARSYADLRGADASHSRARFCCPAGAVGSTRTGSAGLRRHDPRHHPCRRVWRGRDGCALREAIQAANTDAAFGGCPAGNGDDTITLPAGTYILSIAGANDDLNQSGDLDIRSNITINGAGAASTIIDGAATDRVLDVLFGAAFSISNITIRNGNVNGTGGGINVPSNGARVTITDAAISGNTATGSSGGGGGIDNNSSGTLTITNSTISGNAVTGSSGDGGGIDNSGALTLTNSTVSGNVASGSAGRGGGIANQNGTANVTFTTITGNSATKGGGGILANGGQVNLRATIVETSPFESTCDEKSGGNIDSQGSNVADDGTCFTGGLNGDQVVESALLGPLTNNGGPTQPNETFTVTLSSPTNGAIGRSLGRGTIVDNDGPPGSRDN